MTLSAGGAVTMTVPMAMTVLMKQYQTDDVNDEACNADIQHPVCVLYLMHVRQSLDCFHKDCETQCYQKDGVDKSTKNLCSRPAVCVLM